MIDEKTIDEKTLRKVVGLADACELLANATSFPNDALVDALSDGRLVADAKACLEDIGIEADEASIICEPWAKLVGESYDRLLSDLGRAHSLLFVRQGNGVAVWPYESAFLHVEAGKDGEPALFRSAVTLDVEKMMREAGGLPQDSRTEPCDSVWDEFMFLSYLLGSVAKALDSDDETTAKFFYDRFEAFVEKHTSRWFPGFFDAILRKLPKVARPDSIPDLFYKGLCSYNAHLIV